MRPDRATVEEWIAGGALSDAEALRVVGEDWLRKEEALEALLEWAERASYHVPRGEDWYIVRDAGRAALAEEKP